VNDATFFKNCVIYLNPNLLNFVVSILIKADEKESKKLKLDYSTDKRRGKLIFFKILFLPTVPFMANIIKRFI
jgi:hypothetical protein